MRRLHADLPRHARALPAGTHMDELETHSVKLTEFSRRQDSRRDSSGRTKSSASFPLTLDPPPTEELLTRILARRRPAAPRKPSASR